MSARLRYEAAMIAAPRVTALMLVVMVAACGRGPLQSPTPPQPVAAKPAGPAWVARKVVPDAVEGPAGRLHTVKSGETGIAIARAYGVKWSAVAAANQLKPPFVLVIGQQLRLPARRAVAAMSLEARAAAFRVDIDDLITGGEPAGTRPGVRSATARPGDLAPRFVWPLDGRIVSGFGAKPGGRFNDGVNIAATPGAPVRAAADGTVAYAGDALAGFGNLLLIRHDGGWVTAYAHNEALLVTRGAVVRQGDAVARAGGTGAVETPQLHFEVRRGRAPVDPVKTLPPRATGR